MRVFWVSFVEHKVTNNLLYQIIKKIIVDVYLVKIKHVQGTTTILNMVYSTRSV